MSETTSGPSVVVVTSESPSENLEQFTQERAESVELGRLIESNHQLQSQVSEMALRLEVMESRLSSAQEQLERQSAQMAELLEAVELAKAEVMAEAIETEAETDVEQVTPPEPEPEPEVGPESEPESPKVTAPKWARMLLGAG